ncbi:MAG: putative DNA binding domain-containing protein [Verrucomicrobia bacterium]|nr:putative DNA binding domain-containing protein [Verrucomicrobiota bacterium]
MTDILRYPEMESSFLEFKREAPKNDQIIKTIIGFCNQKGGKLVIGVADDRTIIGIAEDEVERLLEALDNMIYEACHPTIIPIVSQQRFGEKNVVIISVSQGMNKPYFRKSEGMNRGTYIRIGRSTVKATPEIIEELKWQSHNIDFEKLPVYRAKANDVDEKQVQTFLNSRKNLAKAALSEEIMRSYSLIVEEHHQVYPTHAGLLLFGKEPQFYLSEAMIICCHMKGIEGREAIASIDCIGTLVNQYHQAHNFILSRLFHSFQIKGMIREQQLEIPEIAFREALLNLLIHRNYHLPAPSKIFIYDDRLEFFSPGNFWGPIRSDQLLRGITYLRNPAICKVFRELGLVEKMGTGFIQIFQSYEKWGLPPPQVIEGENFVKCILPRPTLTKTVAPTPDILTIFHEKEEITIHDIISKYAVSRATAQRWLQALVREGKIDRIGKTRNIHYRRSSNSQ